jgi:ketosteroid isomerase-like protein
MTTQTIADEHAIRSLVHCYADAASRRDPAGVASTFTVDGEWHAPELGRFTGRDVMVAFFTSMLGGWNMFLQGLQSGVVVVDATNPDRATGRWFVQETGQRAEGANLIIAGVYHDEYVRDAGSWLIARRRYDPLLRNADGAVTALPFPTDVPAIGR